MQLSKLLPNCLLLFALATTACTGSCDPQERLVIIRYRETMMFNQYQGISSTGPFGIASYFMITCISNRGARPSDFTFNINNISAVNLGNGGAADIVSGTRPHPITGWKPASLTAGQRFVAAGQAVNPSLSQGYGLVAIWSQGTFESEVNQKHELRYATIEGQPVLIVADPGTPPPAYGAAVNDGDFTRGRFPNTPPASFGSCP